MQLPACLLGAAPPAGPAGGPTGLRDAAFRVQPRRHLPHFLSPPHPATAETAFFMASTIHQHFFAKLAHGLMSMQHALGAHLERSEQDRCSSSSSGGGGWRPRNPFRRRHVDEQQQAARRASRQAQSFGDRALACEREMKLDEAIELYAAARAADPASPEWAARESKVWSDSGYMPGTPTERAIEVNRRAIELGLRAVEADPNSVFGHVALCVSRGRLATFTRDNKQKVQLARQAQDDVKRALALDPSSDLAHHLLGRWHYEMASVNAVVRTIIHFCYGASLMAGSYREAALCFAAAAELRPDRAIHRVELGRTYLKLGDKVRGRAQLEAAVGLDVEDINAHLQLLDAEETLKRLNAALAKEQGGRG